MRKYEFWFVVGSQFLYGPETLAIVDARAKEMAAELSKVLPYPLVWLTTEERKQIGEIWPALGEYCEVGLTWFVTGEKELNDENWEAFQKGMDELQMENIISIWNRALERRQ